MESRPIYVDVDGTLTTASRSGWGPPREDVIAAVKAAIAAGNQVYLWSAGGEEYCREFAAKYEIAAHGFLCKPGVMVDDACRFRANYRMKNMAPDEFAAKFREPQ